MNVPAFLKDRPRSFVNHCMRRLTSSDEISIDAIVQVDSEAGTFKVVDSCQTCSTKCSDTFRSFLYVERSKNLEKKYVITVQKNFTFLRGFDRKNKVFGISRNLIDRFVFK